MFETAEYDVFSNTYPVVFVPKGEENIMIWLKMSPQYCSVY